MQDHTWQEHLATQYGVLAAPTLACAQHYLETRAGEPGIAQRVPADLRSFLSSCIDPERMLALWQEDGLMVSELGARLFLDSGTLTPLLKRLEAGGLVSRLRDTQDERRVLLRLTATGRRLKARAARIPACIMQATQSSLPELSALTRDLQALRERLSA